MKMFSKTKGEAKFKEAKPKTSLKSKLKNGTVTVTEFVLGDAHFVSQSITDGIARTEARIVHRLTGELKPQLRAERRKATALKQAFLKDQYFDFIDKIQKSAGIVDDAVVSDINPGEND